MPLGKPLSLLALALGTLVPVAAGAQSLIPRESHPWGSFAPGSWKRMRIVTETVNEKGELVNVSTTESTTTLVSAGDNQYCLRMEISVDVGGKRFSPPAQELKQGYSGEAVGQLVDVKKVGTETVLIGGEKVASEVREVTVNGESANRVSRVYYSPDVPPFVLKRETQLIDGKGQSAGGSEVEVVAIDMPTRVLADIRNASHVKTVQRTPSGTVVSFEVCCEDVPGSVVSSSTKELDSQGNLVRRSTMELVDYHAASDEQTQTWKNRRQARRAQRR